MSLQRPSLGPSQQLSFDELVRGWSLVLLSHCRAEHLATCMVDTQRVLPNACPHWRKAILNLQERATQTLCDFQWKNTASSEAQSCPQIKPEPDRVYRPNHYFIGQVKAGGTCEIYTGMQLAKLRLWEILQDKQSSLFNRQLARKEERFKKQKNKKKHLKIKSLKDISTNHKMWTLFDFNSKKLFKKSITFF